MALSTRQATAVRPASSSRRLTVAPRAFWNKRASVAVAEPEEKAGTTRGGGKTPSGTTKGKK